MKLELTYDEVLAIEGALFLRVEEIERNAQECAKLGDMDGAKFWQGRTELYRKTYNTVVAQHKQADEKYEQALAEVGKMEGSNEHTGGEV